MLLFYLCIFVINSKSLLVEITFCFGQPFPACKVIYLIAFINNTNNEISVLMRFHECFYLRNTINGFVVIDNLLKNSFFYECFKRVP